MTNFPNGAATYTPPNPATGGVLTVLATHYLRERTTQSAKYACDVDGNIYQVAK
jgi:hypothetical protein